MSISEYITQQKNIQKSLLEYLEHENSDNSYYENLIKLLDNPNIRKSQPELSTILRLIADISNNHKRTPDFFNKIGKIILFFKDDIKQTFSNLQIFKIFRKNKHVLLFLMNEKILTPDKTIIEKCSYENYKKKFYPCFFYPELKSFMDEKLMREVQPKIDVINKQGQDAFENFRKVGENHEHICELIRKDSIEEFVNYVNENKLMLSKAIEPSVFETNPFLLRRTPTLIEYSAFYGSLKIFNYLLQNNIQLTSSIWLYAIHSKSMELIHILEEKNLQPQDPTYNECLIKAIKCHHNEIADYIKNHFLKDKELSPRVYSQTIGSRNYQYFPDDLSKSNEFYDLCKYNYITLVDMLLNNDANIDVNTRVKRSYKAFSEKTPLCVAIEKGNQEIVSLLLKVDELDVNLKSVQSDKSRKYTEEKTALHIAVETGNDEIFKLLLAHKQIEIGEGAFYGCSALKQIEIPSTVTIIGDNAFKFCSSLEFIIIPDTVTEIGDNAFRGCSSLQKILLPKTISFIGNNAFEGCQKLLEIDIPSLVPSIGAYTFKGCSSLQKVIIPEAIKSVGSYAFQGCSSLKQICLPDSVTALGAYAFDGCVSLVDVKISSSVTSIGNYTFQTCSSLASVKIPDSVRSIGRFGFRGCTSMKTVEIGSSVGSILDHAFKGCSSLEKVIIPNNVKQIGENAFEACVGLKSVELSSSLTALGKFLFRGCKLLSDVRIPESVKVIGSDAFSGCASITSMEIPTSITSIGRYVFEGCTSLTHITIPPSVTSLGGYAFRGCKKLTELVIPPSIKTIEVATFEDCVALEKLTLPSTVHAIQADAFKGCTSLKSLAIPSSVESIDNLGIDESVQVTRF